MTAPSHALARQRSVDPLALAEYPLILYEAGSNTRRVQDRVFAEEAIPIKVAMETENVEIIKAMVSAGLGVTVIPLASVARELSTGRFAATRLRGRKLYPETGWVLLRSGVVPGPIAAMLDLFAAMKKQFARPRGGTPAPAV